MKEIVFVYTTKMLGFNLFQRFDCGVAYLSLRLSIDYPS